MILVGGLAGLLGGLLGIGGGIITVPSLLLVFHLMGYTSSYTTQVAVGTSLGAMVFTSAFSAWAHYQKQGVNWSFFRHMALSIILGAILGALIADIIPSKKLQMICGIAECCVGLYFLLPNPQKDNQGEMVEPPRPLLLFPIGIAVGTISSILGIGGGIITVPILTAFGVHLRNAISTSAVLGFLIACVGAITFLSLGFTLTTFPHSLGFLYLPGFFLIGLSSALTTFYGAHLTYTLPIQKLRIIFALIMIAIGIIMIIA